MKIYNLFAHQDQAIKIIEGNYREFREAYQAGEYDGINFSGLEDLLSENRENLIDALTGLNVQHFNFSRCKLTDTTLFPLLEKLRSFSPLLSLNFSANLGISNVGYLLLFAFIQQKGVLSLTLQDNKLEPSFAREILGPCLPRTALTHLDITDNHIGDEGFGILGDVLTRTHLETLNIAKNSTTENAARVLEEKIKSSQLKSSDIANIFLNLARSRDILAASTAEQNPPFLPAFTGLQLGNPASSVPSQNSNPKEPIRFNQ